jgi:hypothetical protein
MVFQSVVSLFTGWIIQAHCARNMRETVIIWKQITLYMAIGKFSILRLIISFEDRSNICEIWVSHDSEYKDVVSFVGRYQAGRYSKDADSVFVWYTGTYHWVHSVTTQNNNTARSNIWYKLLLLVQNVNKNSTNLFKFGKVLMFIGRI